METVHWFNQINSISTVCNVLLVQVSQWELLIQHLKVLVGTLLIGNNLRVDL
ncbi:hypothetical protein D3C80_2198710 [compost metagenome]